MTSCPISRPPIRPALAAALAVALIGGDVGAAVPSQPRSADPLRYLERPMTPMSRLGVGFVENLGRWDERVVARAGCPGYDLFVTKDGAVLVPPDDTPLAFDLARPADTRLTGQRSGSVNFLIGPDESKWTRHARHFDGVEQRGATADVAWSLERRGARFDVRFPAGSGVASFSFGLRGARSVSAGADGSLRVKTARGEVRASAPVAWEEHDGMRTPVTARWIVAKGGRAAFDVERRDASRVLVVDPVFEYATAFGGTGQIETISFVGGDSMSLGPGGSVHVCGTTTSTDFPVTAGAFHSARLGEQDGFAVKLAPDGGVAYATYFGGTSGFLGDGADAVVADAQGAAYLTGLAGDGFPTTAGAFNRVFGGNTDVFVSKLSVNGDALVWSGLLGGSGVDRGLGLALDPATGIVYACGFATAAGFPRISSIRPAGGPDPSTEGFAAKISADGSTLLYSSVFGGSNSDVPRQIALAAGGAVVITGNTSSADLPTTPGVVKPATSPEPTSDWFAAKIAPGGDSYVYLTYFGDDANTLNNCTGMALDSQGRLVFAGESPAGSSFPATTAGVVQPARGGGGDDLFVLRLAADASAIEFATFLGGSGSERGFPGGGLALDSSDAIYVTTGTTSADYPVTDGQVLSGTSDATVTKLSPDAGEIVWSTYVGGSGTENTGCIAIDASGDVYVAGVTNSPDLPEATYSGTRGGLDVFVAKVLPPGDSNGAPRTLTLVITKGKLTDSATAGKDSFKAKGTLAFDASSPDAKFDPLADAVAVVVGGGDGTGGVGGDAGAGWKTNKKGKLTWKTPKGALPKAVLIFDPAKGTFSFKVSGLDLSGAPGSLVKFDLTIGNDSGLTEKVWSQKKPGQLTFP